MKIKSRKKLKKELLKIVLEQRHWDLAKNSQLLRISLQQLKSNITIYGLKKPELQRLIINLE